MFIQTSGPLAACLLNDCVLKKKLLRIWGPPGARGPGARAPMAPLLIRHCQGSVLGPILFLVYIDDLEEGVTGNILKFADDTKLFRKTKEIGDKQKLQDDIDKLVRWSEKWQMLFNVGNVNVYTQDLETLA